VTFTLRGNGTIANGTVSPLTITINAGGTASGNLCVVWLSMPGYTAAPTFTFPANWVQGPIDANGAGACAQIWYLEGPNNPGGITTISVSFTGGTTSTGATIAYLGGEFPGNLTPTAFDVSGHGHGTTNLTYSELTSAVTTGADELAVAVTAVYNSALTTQTLGPGTGFTQLAALNSGSSSRVHAGMDYQLDTGASGQTITDSETVTVNATAFAWAIATFKEAAVVAGATPAPIVSPSTAVVQAANW